MHPIAIPDICSAITGRPSRAVSPWVSITEISQDSGGVVVGSLFVALKGKRADGHDFVREAKERGAVCAVVERYVDADICQLLVPSTHYAMGDLCRLYHSRLDIPVIAVTGSVGKTSTKEMIAHALSAQYRTHQSRGNFNNELGVPIESFRIDPMDRVSVLELAMRGRGQISYLSRMVRPHIGVITNVGISHIEKLGTREEIARAKMELVDGMDAKSTLVLNRDDTERYELFSRAARGQVVSFGESKDADFRISNVQMDNRGRPSFAVNGVPVRMTEAKGRQHVYNGAATFAVATQLNVLPEVVADRLATFATPPGRGSHSRAKSGALILDNSYNAAPDSIRESLFTLADLKKKGARVIAVIGDMLELGGHSEEAHRYVGRLVKESGLDVLVTVGESARFVGEAAGMKAWVPCETATDATRYLLRELHKDDIVMLHGSRAILLDTVADALERGELQLGPELPKSQR